LSSVILTPVRKKLADLGQELGPDRAIAVVADDRHPSSPRPLAELGAELRQVARRGLQLVLDVVTHDLLFDRVASAAQYTGLGRSSISVAFDDAASVDTAALKSLEEPASASVLSHDAEGQRLAVETGDVGDRVAAPSRGKDLLLVAQDQNRSLTTDPLGAAGDKPVGHQIHQHDHRLAGHAVDELEQTRGRRSCACLGHCAGCYQDPATHPGRRGSRA
jgi:hypothetical protein